MGSSLTAGFNYTRIGEKTLTVAGSNLDIQNIPSGYKFLIGYIQIVSTNAGALGSIRVSFNGNTSILATSIKGTSGGAITAVGTSGGTSGQITDGQSQQDPGSYILQVSQTAISSRQGWTCFGGCSSTQFDTSGYWNSTGEINRITVTAGSGTMDIGSNFILYGVR